MILTADNSLSVSEHFYSIQGEGPTVGVPSYFIRLQGCNLMCGGTGGCKVKTGEATWWCDTETVWRKGKKYSFDDLYEEINDRVDWCDILNGEVNIIWTGGEPTLIGHQKGIVGFMKYLEEKHPFNKIYQEIETNGTQVIGPDLFFELSQINCSVKLENSGNDKKQRIVPEALHRVMDHHNYNFKFVVSEEKDFIEIQKDFIEPFNIPTKNIIIMPGVDNRDNLPERTKFIFEMAKKYKYRAVTRQHILAWDKVTGV